MVYLASLETLLKRRDFISPTENPNIHDHHDVVVNGYQHSNMTIVVLQFIILTSEFLIPVMVLRDTSTQFLSLL